MRPFLRFHTVWTQSGHRNIRLLSSSYKSVLFDRYQHATMLEKLWLGIRSVAMIVLFPGTVAVYIPHRILEPTSIPNLVSWTLSHYAAVMVLTCGVAILLKCVRDFTYIGSGTLAPFDETHKLVVAGLYRYVRNPMYVGVMLILLGESWFFWSIRLLEYTGICFVVANILVVGFEEVRLRHKYGDEYRRYSEWVGRWIPGRSCRDGG